jgi:hypothetical protein
MMAVRRRARKGAAWSYGKNTINAARQRLSAIDPESHMWAASADRGASRLASDRSAAIRIGATPRVRKTESAKIRTRSSVWNVPLIK